MCLSACKIVILFYDKHTTVNIFMIYLCNWSVGFSELLNSFSVFKSEVFLNMEAAVNKYTPVTIM